MIDVNVVVNSATPAELQELTRQASQRLSELQNTEQTTRAQLLDKTTVKNQVDRLLTQSAQLDALIAAQSPGPLKDTMQILRTVSNNTIRLLRVTGGILDSSTTG